MKWYLKIEDSDRQVRGINNLRIADASVIPNLIRGHTMAPTILAAERVADFIMNNRSAW